MLKRLFLVAAGCGLILPAVSTQLLVLANDQSLGHMYRLDLDTLSRVDLGVTNAYIPFGLESMDDGRQLSVGYTDPEDPDTDLFDFQTLPGQVVAPVSLPRILFGPAEYDGRLYAVDWDANAPYNSALIEMNPQTGEYHTIASFPEMSITDLAVDENGNAYLMQRISGSVSELFRVDLVTGELTDVGESPFIAGFDFTASGELIGSDRFGHVYEIDRLTGGGTYLGEVNFTGEVLGFTVIVPEPATVLA